MSLFKEIESKPFEYLFLCLAFTVTIVLFFIFGYDRHFQRNVVYGAAGVYFLWSLYHHYRRGDLELSIIIEYLTFILLGLIVLTSTLI